MLMMLTESWKARHWQGSHTLTHRYKPGLSLGTCGATLVHAPLSCFLQEAEECGNDLMASLMAASHAAGDSHGGSGGHHDDAAGLVATLNQQFSLDVEVVAAMAQVGHGGQGTDRFGAVRLLHGCTGCPTLRF
jgi:hypothetical protein